MPTRSGRPASSIRPRKPTALRCRSRQSWRAAATAYANYVNLLPNKDKSDKAEWARAEIRFLRSFGQRLPFDMDPGADEQTYTMDFRLEKEKIIVRAKV